MTIERGQPNPHYRAAVPHEAAAQIEQSAAPHIPSGVEALAPEVIARTSRSSNREMGAQNGATPISAARNANEVAKPMLSPRPPQTPSPRRPHAGPKEVFLEPMGGPQTLQIEPIRQARAPAGVPDFRGPVSSEIRAAFRERLAHRQPPPALPRGTQAGMKLINPSELPASSRPRKEQPANLTMAFTVHQETKARERAARNADKAHDPNIQREQMQAKADQAYELMNQCAAKNRNPVLKDGVLQMGSSKGKAPLDLKTFEHIGNIFIEARASTYMKVWATHGKQFVEIWEDFAKDLRDHPSEEAKTLYQNIDKALRADYQKVREVAVKPPESVDQLMENILAGDAETAEMLIFSHRESSLTARPFESLRQKLLQVDHPSTPENVRQAAYENALAFTKLYLEMGVSIPCDPEKKAALKQEIQALLQHVANQKNPHLADRLKEAQQSMVRTLQAPAEKDVLFALRHAQEALKTNHDIEGALRVLELTRGRIEPDIVQAKEDLQKALKANRAIRYDFKAKSAKQIAADLGGHIEYNFRGMRPSEIDIRSLKESSRNRDAPAVTEEMTTSNQVTQFLSNQILSARPDKIAVAKAMIKVLDIGEEALEKGNYPLAMCVFGVFAFKHNSEWIERNIGKDEGTKENRAINRLFNQDVQQRLQNFRSFWNADDNYRNYQTKLNQDRSSGRQVIPSLVPLRQDAARLEVSPINIDGQVDPNLMNALADKKRAFAQDLRSLKQRPLPRGDPAVSVELMRNERTKKVDFAL